MADLSDIITSKVRIKILILFYGNLNEIYHVRGISREIGEEINAVRRELERLEKAGIIDKENRGNRIYYWARADYPMFGDILAMVCKNTGLGSAILSNRSKLGNINYVMFSGKFARRKPRKKEDDVDVLIVGNIDMQLLSALVRAEESKREHEINYTVMSREELDFRKKRRDPFLLSIFLSSRVLIIGDEDTLVS